MTQTEFRAIRVLNNNAVVAHSLTHPAATLATTDVTSASDTAEMVLIGKGIGFGTNPGDVIDGAKVQHRYAAIDPSKLHILRLLTTLDQSIFDAITSGVELAESLLGELAPSVYLSLTDHIAFSLERINRGETIDNPLLVEIRTVFPEEYQAAELVVGTIKNDINVALPPAEVAYIALHLNAARLGVPVKSPLGQANFMAGLVSEAKSLLGVSGMQLDDAELISELLRIYARVRANKPRSTPLTFMIQRDMPAQYAAAERLLAHMYSDETNVREWKGESAMLAVLLHSWTQSVPSCSVLDHCTSVQIGAETATGTATVDEWKESTSDTDALTHCDDVSHVSSTVTKSDCHSRHHSA
ncbi:MAG: PRD domain-containing protein [Actinomycetaceae bacterium]|nr:PRD domain-containing protein [Arcanobacterium sp.]MDD7687287.1 PRD domain-containing protein [Actinomycetaceae bacterium]MDY5273565.1 PRD domain-containing protein [Arcanobacterium sp.]